MTPSDREAAGQRIARARRRRGLSQAVLAGLVGRSESWLSQVERGKRGVDSHSVLVRLAEVLRVDIEELVGSADRDETGRRAYAAAPLIEQAMMGYETPGPLDSGDEPGREANLDFLRAQARSAYQAYQATRYDSADRILPGLIRGVEMAARTARGASPAACAVRARVYDTTAALLSRVGEPFLAWAAADRAMFAADQSGDSLLAAASAWRLSYMITGRKHPREALELAMAAAAALGRTVVRAPSPERLSVYGALHLAAATAAAASFDRAATESLLGTARGIADHAGEANHMGTAFGPVNVAIHAVSASPKLGDLRTATQTGEALDLAAIPVGLVGRRTQVNLDLGSRVRHDPEGRGRGQPPAGRRTAQPTAGPL
jgi:transcriptional regulator with XRE-family HTH domain